MTRADFKDLSDEEWGMMETMDPFKVLVSHLTSEITLKDDSQTSEEIGSFKKIAHKVPAVITTNYDEFLERYVFTDFSVLVYPDDYYFNSSSGYDEILKIHGSVSDPGSIVITDEDYRRLKLESKVITARLTSMMCQNPIIFIGYSISDEEVHSLILDMLTSLRQTDLDMIRGHLIRVNVRPGLIKSEWNPKTETFRGKKVEVMQIDMPNLNVLYRYLDRFTPVATPHEIRKYQEMIRDIVLSTDFNTRKVELIDVDDIDKTKPEDLAVVFGKSASIGTMIKGILGYDTVDALLDVLLKRNGNLDTSVTHFTQWLAQKRICKGRGFSPVFHYLLKYDIDISELSEDSKEYTTEMASKIERKLSEIASKCASVSNRKRIKSFLDSQTRSFPRCEALAYFQFNGLLTREECRRMLVNEYNNDCEQFKSTTKIKTDLRAAVMMLDYEGYKRRTGICTLPH